jgi:hypothetical protein
MRSIYAVQSKELPESVKHCSSYPVSLSRRNGSFVENFLPDSVGIDVHPGWRCAWPPVIS